jgi:ElaB/YqjD/DUF883 family membrane-anchored ribosome-binding protein
MANQRNESTQRDPANGRDKNAMGNIGTSDMGDGIEKAKDTAKTLLDQAKSTAGDAYESVAEKASTSLEEKKAGLTGGLMSVADSIRRVGDNLNETPDRTPVADYSARYAQTAAKKLEDVAHYFETKDLKSVGRDIEMYARRNPAVFLGGAFALGLLAARFLKSSPTPSINYGTTAPDHQLTPGTGSETERGRVAAPGTI